MVRHDDVQFGDLTGLWIIILNFFPYTQFKKNISEKYLKILNEDFKKLFPETLNTITLPTWVYIKKYSCN